MTSLPSTLATSSPKVAAQAFSLHHLAEPKGTFQLSVPYPVFWVLPFDHLHKVWTVLLRNLNPIASFKRL